MSRVIMGGDDIYLRLVSRAPAIPTVFETSPLPCSSLDHSLDLGVDDVVSSNWGEGPEREHMEGLI